MWCNFSAPPGGVDNDLEYNSGEDEDSIEHRKILKAARRRVVVEYLVEEAFKGCCSEILTIGFTTWTTARCNNERSDEQSNVCLGQSDIVGQLATSNGATAT